MRPIIYNVAASLDGFIADAEGKFEWIPEDETVDFAAIFANVDTVLIGRRSYEDVRRMGGEPWRPGMRVYLFSRGVDPASVRGITVVREDAASVVAALREEAGDGEIWLFGGGTLFAALLAAGQVDRVEVTLVPILLGGGVPLAPAVQRTKLILTKTHRYPTGMVSLSYEVDRDIRTSQRG